MKKILVTGANGLLGQALIRILSPQYQILATGNQPQFSLTDSRVRYRQLDLTQAQECKHAIKKFQPDIIINAGAYTDVDGCESRREKCWRVNVRGVENLCAAARVINARIIQLSTDYLFDGQAGPYDEQALPEPLCYYAKSKLASENVLHESGEHHAIVRTSVVYGIGKNLKNNFFMWLYQQFKAGKPVRIVTDQYNTPTWVDDLAAGIKLVIAKNARGIYNISGPDYLSRLEYAMLLAKIFKFDDARISAIRTAELHQAAKRPLNAGLKINKARNELGYQPHATAAVFKILRRRYAYPED